MSRSKDLQGLTSTHHVGLQTVLSEWKNKQMGNSGVIPQYVVKAFLEAGYTAKNHEEAF